MLVSEDFAVSSTNQTRLRGSNMPNTIEYFSYRNIEP